MAYFNNRQDGIDRAGKVLADILCGLLMLAFSIIFFGIAGGLFAFLVVEGLLMGVDYVVPKPDETSGAVIR